MLECIVTKFGGSSLANDEQFRKVRSILELEPTRRYLVPSAPGKRFPKDEKVTDLLYACHALAQKGKPFESEFGYNTFKHGIPSIMFRGWCSIKHQLI